MTCQTARREKGRRKHHERIAAGTLQNSGEMDNDVVDMYE